MESTSRLYHTLTQLFGQYDVWKDKRHFKALAWMVVGLIFTGQISPTAWLVYVNTEVYAQSIVRRFQRWLKNERIEVNNLYGPIIQSALAEWNNQTLYLALDTSMLWDTYCLIRISIIYRGRSVPLTWKVIEHGSSSVAFETYVPLIEAARLLLPYQATIVFLADRGFVDTSLMKHLASMRWTWLIRAKSSLTIYRRGHRPIRLGHVGVQKGQALFWHKIYVTGKKYGPVYLALGHPQGVNEKWAILSNQPTHVTTFDAYGLRFDIEEGFLDDKSNGFQLESSLNRSEDVLTRLCLVLALATLYLVSQGTEVVQAGKRRLVDAHWFRGSSYLKIGWSYVRRALVTGDVLIGYMRLDPQEDPDPAIASRKQDEERHRLCFRTSFEVFKPYATAGF
jgi:hypothetical protein